MYSSSVLPWYSSTTPQYLSEVQLVCPTAASQRTLLAIHSSQHGVQPVRCQTVQRHCRLPSASHSEYSSPRSRIRTGYKKVLGLLHCIISEQSLQSRQAATNISLALSFVPQCCRVAIIYGLVRKIPKIYLFVFYHYPLATLATQDVEKDTPCCLVYDITSNGG